MKGNDINKYLQINFIASVIFVLGCLIIPFVKSNYMVSSIFVESEFLPVVLVFYILLENIIFTTLFIHFKGAFTSFKWSDFFLISFVILFCSIIFLIRNENLVFILYVLVLVAITMAFVSINIDNASKHIACYEGKGPLVFGVVNFIRICLFVVMRYIWVFMLQFATGVKIIDKSLSQLLLIGVSGFLIYVTYEFFKHKMVDTLVKTNLQYFGLYTYLIIITYLFYNIMIASDIYTQAMSIGLELLFLGIVLVIDGVCEKKLQN